MTTKKEYNPIVGGGDILAFLNEPAAGTPAAAAAKPAPIKKPAAKGLNLKSDEMFPSLGGDQGIVFEALHVIDRCF